MTIDQMAQIGKIGADLAAIEEQMKPYADLLAKAEALKTEAHRIAGTLPPITKLNGELRRTSNGYIRKGNPGHVDHDTVRQYIVAHGPVHVRDIAHATKSTRSHVSIVAGGLVRGGKIKRVAPSVFDDAK